MAIRVLITDDHGVVRQGPRMFLSLDPDIEVVGEAANGQEAVIMARDLNPDMDLMDLLMRVMDGIEATKAIRSELPDVEVIALTSVLKGASVTGAGTLGYLLTNTEAKEPHRAVKASAEGQHHLASEAAAKLMDEVRAPVNPEALTERETEVLRLLARGKANKQIATSLFVSEKKDPTPRAL
jgi:two-component system, NarL family, response regulator LiaR